MRLNNQDPKNYINRTICYRGHFYFVSSVDQDNTVHLYDHVKQKKGLLRPDQWAASTLYPNADEVATRYRRLIAVMRDVCLLTQTEAHAAIIGHLTHGPFFYGSEALARIGGSAFAVRRAINHRHRSQAHRRNRPAGGDAK